MPQRSRERGGQGRGWEACDGFGEGKGSRLAKVVIPWEGHGVGSGGGRHGEGETVSPGGLRRVSAVPCLGLCSVSTSYGTASKLLSISVPWFHRLLKGDKSTAPIELL